MEVTSPIDARNVRRKRGVRIRDRIGKRDDSTQRIEFQVGCRWATYVPNADKWLALVGTFWRCEI